MTKTERNITWNFNEFLVTATTCLVEVPLEFANHQSNGTMEDFDEQCDVGKFL